MVGTHLYEKDRENSKRQTFTGIHPQWRKMSTHCCLADLFLFDATIKPYLSHGVVNVFMFVQNSHLLQKLTLTYQISVSCKNIKI